VNFLCKLSASTFFLGVLGIMREFWGVLGVWGVLGIKENTLEVMAVLGVCGMIVVPLTITIMKIYE